MVLVAITYTSGRVGPSRSVKGNLVQGVTAGVEGTHVVTAPAIACMTVREQGDTATVKVRVSASLSAMLLSASDTR